MNEGWIKIWESTIYHHVWRDDPVAWRVFEYLLLTSYRGTPQGTTVIKRHNRLQMPVLALLVKTGHVTRQ
jgi:hypothetical protein